MCLTTDHPGVDSSGQIEKFQEKALMELQDYVQKTYPDDIYRYSRNIVIPKEKVRKLTELLSEGTK